MSTSEAIGRFQGQIHPEFDTPEMRAWLCKLPEVPECEAFSADRDHVRSLRGPGSSPALALKRYIPPPRWKSNLDDCTHRGSRARRAFDHACHLREHGVATPRPVAWLEQHQEGRIQEQYLVTECLPDACTLKEALLHHYYENPLCSEIMQLLQVVADVFRSMHDCGFEHRDAGNQNFMVRRNEQGTWEKAWVIDLHRGRIHSSLSPAKRGRDNARITLPSDLRRVFFEMQFAPQTIPPAFLKAETKARKQHALKRNSAVLRHPLRKSPPEDRKYPEEKDIWIWDDRSMQAIPALKSKDKRKYYRKSDLYEMASVNARYRKKLKKEFQHLQSEAWSRPVPMSDTMGLSINLEKERFEKERRWLKPLGPIPLLVRLYHHQDPSRQRYGIEAVRKLTAEGHAVTVALVQDRRAITYPASWQEFVDKAGGALSGFVEGVEVGHAINRVKWGIWNMPEYRQLLEPFQNWKEKFPQIPLMGPAGIDFEFPRVLPMLEQWPENSLSAFSHHMYVDRRGDPENRQSGYDTVDKLAWARAIARVHPACAERVVVSEVNWPIKGTGVWSPVGSPYESPGARFHDPSVDEEAYALFLKKYLLLALCSGMAERVYWWNLAAHGFGLIDDRDPGGWRPRPAFHVFQELVEKTRGATFLKREGSREERIYHFRGEAGEFRL